MTMATDSINSELRLLQPEVIYLDAKHIIEAQKMSEIVQNDENRAWQAYLNSLALIGFEEWLTERIPRADIERGKSVIQDFNIIRMGDFKSCLFTTENLLNEIVIIPKNAIEDLNLTAHFYVLFEVVEEQEEVIFRGFLRYDKLAKYCQSLNLQPSDDNCYHLPFSIFDPEPNHLLFYCNYLDSSMMTLPEAIIDNSSQPEKNINFQPMRIKLGNWLQSIFDEGWQAIDTLIDSKTSLTFATRKVVMEKNKIERAKLVDLGFKLRDKTCALLVTLASESEDKLGVLVQLHPQGGERFLPANVRLSLLSPSGKILDEVISRSHDNYIQMKYFRGNPGAKFSIEVSLDDVILKEDFEL